VLNKYDNVPSVANLLKVFTSCVSRTLETSISFECAAGLRKAGYNTWVASSKSHCFVLVEMNDGTFVAYEPQSVTGAIDDPTLDYAITDVGKWAVDTSPAKWAYIEANAEPVRLLVDDHSWCGLSYPPTRAGEMAAIFARNWRPPEGITAALSIIEDFEARYGR